MSDQRPHDAPADVPADGGSPPSEKSSLNSAAARQRSPLAEHLAGLDERRRQIAVALHYDQRSPSLPRVIASGTGGVAEQILNAAFAAGVKVREDADLAEILAAVEVDSEIPLDALAAVAEILSYVYRANGDSDAGS